MTSNNYKFGVYLDAFNRSQQQFGFGIVWNDEKYVHFNLFHYELAIGVTGR